MAVAKLVNLAVLQSAFDVLMGTVRCVVLWSVLNTQSQETCGHVVLMRTNDVELEGRKKREKLMQRGAVECGGACVRACVGCATSCLSLMNVHTTTTPSVREKKS